MGANVQMGARQSVRWNIGLVCIVLAFASYGCGEATSVDKATASIVSTPTPSSEISLNTPILGGSWQAFDNRFGGNNAVDNGWQYQGPFTSTWTGIYEVNGFTNSPPGDPLSRVTNVKTRPYDFAQTWTASQVQTMQAQFMPPDAQLQSTTLVIILGYEVVGSEQVYFSTLLARTLPSADFKDAQGNAVQPGTFYVYLGYGNPDHTLFTECSLGTDESWALMDA